MFIYISYNCAWFCVFTFFFKTKNLFLQTFYLIQENITLPSLFFFFVWLKHFLILDLKTFQHCVLSNQSVLAVLHVALISHRLLNDLVTAKATTVSRKGRQCYLLNFFFLYILLYLNEEIYVVFIAIQIYAECNDLEKLSLPIC